MAAPTSTVNVYGLSDEEIQATAPSIFAMEPWRGDENHKGVSNKYVYIPTIDILAGLRQEGFIPTSVAQSGSRIPGKEAHTKHQICLRRVDELGIRKPNVFEIRLTNSHDRTSSYTLEAGVYRLVCSNGLVRWTKDRAISVQHRGNIIDDVIEGSYRILDDAEETMDEVAEMQSIQLTQPAQLLLAQQIMTERFHLDEEAGEGKTTLKEIPYRAESFLRPRRSEDTGNDVYTRMNVASEWAKRGGVRGYDRQGNRHTTREVRDIGEGTRLDRAAWRFAQELMKLRQSGEAIFVR